MSDPLETIPADDTEEKKWLKATKDIFDVASKRQPPQISRSEVESLIIGLRTNVVTPKGKTVLNILKKYADEMKKKKRNFLNISIHFPKVD